MKLVEGKITMYRYAYYKDIMLHPNMADGLGFFKEKYLVLTTPWKFLNLIQRKI
jgi:hypothetical protein